MPFVLTVLLPPLTCSAEELRIAVGMNRDEVLATLKQHGAIDITSGLAIVGSKNGPPPTGLYWEFRDYDAVIMLVAKNDTVIEMTYWTKRDFNESKLHRFKTMRDASAVTIETATKQVMIEAKRAN